MSRPIALDFGTSAVRIRQKHREETMTRPSVIAVNTHEDTVLATGEEARCLIGRTPAGIRAVRPILDGTVADYEFAVRMINEYFKAEKIRRPAVLTAVPADLTDEEATALGDVLSDAGAAHVRQVPSAIAAALGAGYDPARPRAAFYADLGAGTTDLTVLRRGTPVALRSIRIGGDALNRALCDYLRTERALVIGEGLAEHVKREIGSAHPSVERGGLRVSGRDTESGLVATADLTAKDVLTAYLPVLRRIAGQISDIIALLPSDILAEIRESGIVLCGGTAALPGLAKALASATGIRTGLAPMSGECTVRGLARIVAENVPVSCPSAQNNQIIRKGDSDV